MTKKNIQGPCLSHARNQLYTTAYNSFPISFPCLHTLQLLFGGLGPSGFVSKMAFLAISSECQSIQGNFWNDQVHLTAFKCQIHDKVILHSQVGPLGVSRLNHPDMSPNASGENQCSPLQLSGGDLLIMSALLYSDLQSKKHRTLFTVMYHVIMSNTMYLLDLSPIQKQCKVQVGFWSLHKKWIDDLSTTTSVLTFIIRQNPADTRRFKTCSSAW